MGMTLLILAGLGVLAAVLAVYFLRRRKDDPEDRYVCESCGDVDCTCHKKEPD